MAHQRVTNILLFVIAACLVALTTKQFGVEIIPQAKAQLGATTSQTVRIFGCYQQLGACSDRQVRVNANGEVYSAKN